jgi:hypothetical protein
MHAAEDSDNTVAFRCSCSSRKSEVLFCRPLGIGAALVFRASMCPVADDPSQINVELSFRP